MRGVEQSCIEFYCRKLKKYQLVRHRLSWETGFETCQRNYTVCSRFDRNQWCALVDTNVKQESALLGQDTVPTGVELPTFRGNFLPKNTALTQKPAPKLW